MEAQELDMCCKRQLFTARSGQSRSWFAAGIVENWKYI